MNTLHNHPTILIVMGATGDLMAKKIVPSLFDLFRRDALPSQFSIVGYSRREYTQIDFHRHIAEILSLFHSEEVLMPYLENFLKLFSFQQGTFEDENHYHALERALRIIDEGWGICSNKLFYLAVSGEYYESLFTHLQSSGLSQTCGQDALGWTHVVVEKPFGDDGESAEKLERSLTKVFREEQIYRVDHYLAKEMVRTLIPFRFSNNVFESSWNADCIQSIHIRFWEALGVEQRGAFYDRVGALRDVGQNHLLQMLTFLTMDRPESLSIKDMRHAREVLLGTLRFPTETEIKTGSLRAQYDGYRSIHNVKPESMTETYFKIHAFLDTPRWRGMPIILEGGKRMGEQRKEIIVTMKHPEKCLCPNDSDHAPSTITIQLEPEEKIEYTLSIKQPRSQAIELRTMNVVYRTVEKTTQYTEAYGTLLLDCITGDQRYFLSDKEVIAMWRFIDPFVFAWKADAVPLHIYAPDSLEASTLSLFIS